eukprot:CAMPEP_0174923132 /NCGR_PEP_ID=MMETSP1355-20121228/6379_1 /TAXON_ID=464990 /ORGANISM="Hemiselmis tepida, Strain CCMP443" /LENGTH=53 /DNA_ID=CAMNT_0016168789 /DNA_START=175 /DNA_END=333 /DNA_ORIENTATION=-
MAGTTALIMAISRLAAFAPPSSMLRAAFITRSLACSTATLPSAMSLRMTPLSD